MRPNVDKLLSFVLQPTRFCQILVIGCVFFLINSKWILAAVSADFQYAKDLEELMDDATSSAITTLKLSLTVCALNLVHSLCFQHLIEVVRRVVRLAPINRLLLTLALYVLLCAFVIAPGYTAITYVAGMFGRRINSKEISFSFPDHHQSTDFICHFDSRDITTFMGRNPLERDYRDPVTFLHLNQFDRLQPIENSMLVPVFLKMYWRYSTEDIQLPCELRVQLTHHRADQVDFIVWWTKDGTYLDTTNHRASVRSTKYSVSWASPQKEVVGTQWIAINGTLLIRRLRVEDFGLYGCHAAVNDDVLLSRLNPSVLQDRLALYSREVSRLELYQNIESNEIRALHPSNGASVTITYRMLSDSEDDILIEHKVNGVPRKELPEEDKCSSELHWPFLDFSHQQNNLFGRTADKEGNSVVCEEHKFCVEQYHYGLHTFTIRRQFYNADTGKEDYLEVVYGSVLVVPKLSELFSDVQNNAYFGYLHMTDCWENNKTVLSEYCTNKLKHMKAVSRFHYLLDCWTTMVIYILLHLYYVWWTWSLLRYLVSLTLPDVFSKSVAMMVQHHPPTEFHPSLPKCNHVCLAYADSDAEVSGYIKSILQYYNLSVYDCQKDVPLGQPPLTAWDQAMENCSSFVIVISTEYLLEPELVLQFQSIHNMMLEQSVKENHVVLAVAGRCHIPPALGPLAVIDLQQKHWERHLEWWAFCFKGEFPSKTVIDQVGRDFQRDAHTFLVQNRRDDDVQQVLPQFSFLFKKLEAITMPAGLHTADHGATEDDVNRKNKCRLYNDITTSQASIRSECASEGYESYSDFGEEDAVHRIVDSVHDSLTETPLTTDSQQEVSMQLPHLGDELYVSSGPGIEEPDFHDVFLTYCEDSSWDCVVAAEIKAALEGRHSKYNLLPEGQSLHVYDAVQDLLPGKAEVHLVSAAARSSAFVVLMSPAYVQDPITRRLHFPQVLQAVSCDAVRTECVLIVHTSGTSQHLQPTPPHCQIRDDGKDNNNENDDDDGGDDDDDDDDSDDDHDPRREVTEHDAETPDYNAREGEGDLEGGLTLPRWFQAFTHLHWSPCVGLYEEGHLKWWAKHVCHLVMTRLSDSDG